LQNELEDTETFTREEIGQNNHEVIDVIDVTVLCIRLPREMDTQEQLTDAYRLQARGAARRRASDKSEKRHKPVHQFCGSPFTLLPAF
jgi:hypothetical protein